MMTKSRAPKHDTASAPLQPPGHYVYLYRDERGRPRYVGYGKAQTRASVHLTRSHNRALAAFIAKGKYNLEIAGPFGSEAAGRAVETALISALKPDLNVDPGQTRWRFRPLGVPERFADRLLLPPLLREEFLKRRAGQVPCPVIFVRINERDFEDGRVGYNAAHPPTDRQILERMDKWWSLSRFAEVWSNRPSTSPKTLIAISGRPGAQIVAGALRIDRSGWERAEHDGALYVVPTEGPRDLDALGLRGRRVSADADIKFGPFRNQSFLILNCDGTTIGGNPSLRAAERG
jgi:hypothetical protein